MTSRDWKKKQSRKNVMTSRDWSSRFYVIVFFFYLNLLRLRKILIIHCFEIHFMLSMQLTAEPRQFIKQFEIFAFAIMPTWENACLRPDFFISWFTNGGFCNFQEVERSKNYFLFYPPSLNIICFVEKKNIFLRFCLRIFESDTVIELCMKIMKYLKI